MRSTTIFIFSAFVLLSSCNDKHERNGNDRSNDKGNWVDKVTNKDHGPGQEKEYIGDFDEIEVSQAIDAEIIKSETEKVVVYAPANIIDEILIDKIGSKVHIHYKSGIRVMDGHNVKAKIYVKDFSKLIANSAASINIKDKFTQEKTDVEVSSAASITGNLEANEFDIKADSSSSFDGKIWAVDLDVEASSAASINISGKAKKVEVSSSSGSSISAKDFLADNLKADASSGASVEISASSSIDAEASSGGSVNVYKRGNVTNIKKDESSGGSVNIK